MNIAKPFVLDFRFMTQSNCGGGGDGCGNSNSMVCTLEKEEALVILAQKLEGNRHYL